MGNIFGKSNNTSKFEALVKKRKLNEENNSSDDESTLKFKKLKTNTSLLVSTRKIFFYPLLYGSSIFFKSKTNEKINKSNLDHLFPDLLNSTNNNEIEHSAEAKIASFSSLALTSSTGSSREQIDILKTPTKKKMKSTSLYIYNTLFLNGENSDIKVKALNKEWNLHKLYLCQSPYFASMFQNGSNWKESSQSCIEISIPDQNINEKSLDITLGSFYKHDIEIVPLEVINVLACASLLSLEGLINQCSCVMRENFNSDSVLAYYEASLIYGVKEVEEATLKWLCHNLMSCDTIKLNQLNIQLFEKIISSDRLFIIQVETDLYSLCKKWLYFQLNSCQNSTTVSSNSLTTKEVNDFFGNYLKIYNKDYTTLLEIPSLEKYRNIFKKIRLKNLLNDSASFDLMKQDSIVPMSWIEPYFIENWINIIYVDQNKYSHEFEIEKNVFDAECLRFGRILSNETNITWRWVGFNYGIDLLFTYTSDRTIVIKRNVPDRNNSFMNNSFKGLLSNKNTQRIYYVIKILKLNKFGNEIWSKTTDLICQDLNKNEEKVAIKIDTKEESPYLLNFNVIAHP